MTTAINYLTDFSSAEQEREALDQLCDYLVLKGKYKDSDAARKDAKQRVDFLDRADFFSNDETLADASEARKSTAALIQGHNLKKILEENSGYLPDMSVPRPDPHGAADNSSEPDVDDQSAPAADTATPVAGKRSITEIFGAIEMDLRTGMSQQQIVSKLEQSGIVRDNAEDALLVVLRQRRQKQRTRLLAAGTIVILSLVLFYFAR